MAAAEAIILNDKTNSDDPIKELVQELKETNRALNDLVKEPQRQLLTQQLEEQFGNMPQHLLASWQSVNKYWTETMARTMWSGVTASRSKVPACAPSRRTVMRSHNRNTSGRRCET